MIKDICERLSFPTEATEVFVNGYKKIIECGGEPQLALARDLLFDGDTKQYREILRSLSEHSGIHRYTVDMIFLLSCTDRAKQIFDKRGIDEDIYRDTMRDLTEKLKECKRLYDVWGTFVVWWYPGFLRAERFTLGRLQFETQPFPFEDYKGIVKMGDTVYNFHVPSGSPLTYEAVIDSFRRAYKFFRVEGVMPIVFSSWLIYPPVASLFADGSNLRRFYELFDVVESKEYKDNAELWRVFYVPFSPDIDYSTLPESTSLQRGLKKFFLDGGTMGSGKGILLFDGEKVIK